jgi:hypothetical protein
MGHGAGPALLDRQPRLRPVQRLDLGFFVDREHEAVRRRIEIEADHVAQLGGERRIGGQLEAPHPVRLEAVRRLFILELSAFEFEKLRDAVKAAIASIDREAKSLKLRAKRKALEDVWKDLLGQAPAELR